MQYSTKVFFFICLFYFHIIIIIIFFLFQLVRTKIVIVQGGPIVDIVLVDMKTTWKEIVQRVVRTAEVEAEVTVVAEAAAAEAAAETVGPKNAATSHLPGL